MQRPPPWQQQGNAPVSPRNSQLDAASRPLAGPRTLISLPGGDHTTPCSVLPGALMVASAMPKKLAGGGGGGGEGGGEGAGGGGGEGAGGEGGASGASCINKPKKKRLYNHKIRGDSHQRCCCRIKDSRHSRHTAGTAVLTTVMLPPPRVPARVRSPLHR